MATGTENGTAVPGTKPRKNRRPGWRTCCVVGCFNRESDGRRISFYQFPSRHRESERRQRWIEAVQRADPDGKPWQPDADSRICSQHFVGNARSSFMHHTAYVPTIFPANNHHPTFCNPSGQEEHCQWGIQRAQASENYPADSQASQGHRRKVSSANEYGTNASVVDNSTSHDVVNAGAAANPDISASDMVEVHLLELPDVVQDTFSTSAEHDRMNLLQQTAVERIIQEMTSANEHNEQQEVLTMPANSSSVPTVPTLQSVGANATSQGSAKPSPAQQPLSLTTKAEILADVRAGKLSKAEIVYKYHIRWAILYEVIKGASEIDAELERLGLAPERVAEEAMGSPEAPTAEGSQGKASATYKVIFLSEDQYMKPPKKRNHMPGYKPPKRGKALIVQGTPTANTETNSGQIGVAVPMNTPVEVQETGYGGRVKILRPIQAEMQAMSTQTESSSGKGSLMTFLSTTDGAHAMTQVNHRRQADKGSGTGTQNSQELPTDLIPGGYCEDVLSVEALQHFPSGNDINAALVKDETVRWPSAPSSSQPDPAVSPASAESCGFSLSKVKEEVVEDSDTEEVVFDPLVVVKQEPCSPVGGHCDEFPVEHEMNVQHSEQNFQPFAQAVTDTASQWDNVIVKCEPSSP